MTASTDSAVPSFAPPAPYDVSDADVLAALPGRMMQSAEQIVAVRGSPAPPRRTSGGGGLRPRGEDRPGSGRRAAGAAVGLLPKERPTSAPVGYHVHGRGMVGGHSSSGINQA